MVWQYILYFFLYAALGWAAEVCFAAWKEHRLVNRGFLNGPLCPVYGFGMAAMLLLLAPWQGNVLAVFAGGMAITTLIEWLAGWLLYKLFRARWWDYSHLPFNIGGFVCLPFSLLWGAASVVMLLAVHPPIARLAAAIPPGVLRAVDIVLLCLLAADAAGSAAAAFGLQRRLRQLEEVRAALRRASDQLTKVVGTEPDRAPPPNSETYAPEAAKHRYCAAASPPQKSSQALCRRKFSARDGVSRESASPNAPAESANRTLYTVIPVRAKYEKTVSKYRTDTSGNKSAVTETRSAPGAARCFAITQAPRIDEKCLLLKTVYYKSAVFSTENRPAPRGLRAAILRAAHGPARVRRSFFAPLVYFGKTVA